MISGILNGIQRSSFALAVLLMAACAQAGSTGESVGVATDEQGQALPSGRSAFHVTQESYKHSSGKEVLYITFDGVQFTDDAEKPLDRAHQVCHTAGVVEGFGGKFRGYCSAIDDDGDMWWVSWHRIDENGGTWSYLGGTGKYEGETGSGTWTPGGEHGPNMVSNFWKRTR